MKTTDFLAGVAIGAGLSYLLDSRQGGRRRALIRDRMVHAGHTVEERAEGRARDLANRTRGAAIEAANRVATRGEEVEDHILIERVRAELGRATSHAGAVEVAANHGRVTLSGRVEEEEVPEVVARVRHVRGVAEVENRLEARGRE